jgi:phosphoglycolate phosphatase
MKVGARDVLSADRGIGDVRAIAFDLDGTLIDTAPDLALAANAMLEALGYPPLAERQIEALIGNGIDKLVEGVLIESIDRVAGPAMLADGRAHFRRLYAARLFDRSRVYPEVITTLEALVARGIRLCCVTNKHSAFTLPLLDAAALSRFFAFALCADRPDERKPKPDLLLAASARLGVTPSEMLYVGDSPADIAAARAAGCQVAAVDYGYTDRARLAHAHPGWIIGSIAEILTLSASPGFATV